jgi:large subunit ribosomal protein L4
MASTKALQAPLLDGTGKASKDLSLEAAIFGADVKPHLVHETVRAELNAHRAGTRAAKSRGMVAGGRSKPWRQKGTGRARAGTIRAPQFTGGGVAFAPQPRSFVLKVNRKVRRSALRAALSSHVSAGTLAIVDAGAFLAPSTRQAADLLRSWGNDHPLVVVAGADEESLVKSFRNLDRTVVVTPAQLEVSALVWARSVLVTESALADVQRIAS